MSEQSHPISCQDPSCAKPLHGPVSYCPYCGVQFEVTPATDTPFNVEEISNVPEPVVKAPELLSENSDHAPVDLAETPPVIAKETKPEVKIVEPVIAPAQEEIKRTEVTSPITPSPVSPKSGTLKWIIATIVVVLLVAGYFVFGGKGRGSNGVKRGPEKLTASEGKNESTRGVAQDALRQGIMLSLSVSKLPKLEKVLQSAKQLGDISPDYREQVVSAERTLSGAKKDRDNNLMAYVAKLLELKRYSPEQVATALDKIKTGDVTAREKMVADLLITHVGSLQSSSNPNPDKLLSDFNRRFSDYVD